MKKLLLSVVLLGLSFNASARCVMEITHPFQSFRFKEEKKAIADYRFNLLNESDDVMTYSIHRTLIAGDNKGSGRTDDDYNVTLNPGQGTSFEKRGETAVWPRSSLVAVHSILQGNHDCGKKERLDHFPSSGGFKG